MISKSDIRAKSEQRRQEMTDAQRSEKNAQIIQRCQTELPWNDFERVMLFLPIEAKREIYTWPLVHWIWSEWPDVEVCVPRLRDGIIEAVVITPLTRFVVNAWGISEPAEGAILQGETLDLILTPLLGFDAQGTRVGYGKGYYDRFFAAHPQAERVGLAYEAQFSPEPIEAEPHDVPLQMVITEKEIIQLKKPD